MLAFPQNEQPQPEIASQLNTTEAAGEPAPLADVPSRPDIDCDENGIDFYICSEVDFYILGEYTEQGGKFDPSWTFYLLDYVQVTLGDTYYPIGGASNPFCSKLDGKDGGLDIFYFADHITHLFGNATKATFKNLDIYFGCYGEYGKYNDDIGSILFESCLGCNFDGIYFSGELVINNCFGFNGIFGWCFDTIRLHNIQLDLTVDCSPTMAAPSQVLGRFEELYVDSCEILVKIVESSDGGSGISSLLGAGHVEINNSKIEVSSEVDYQVFFDVSAFQEDSGQMADGGIICHEFEFLFNGPGKNYIRNCFITTTVGYLNLYDVRFVSNYNDCGLVGNAQTQPTGGKNYYSGVYMRSGGTTTILDPNFTSYKWRIDTSDESATPALAQFLPTGSKRNPNMESLDMRAWTKAQ